MLWLEFLEHPIRQRAAVMYFELPVGSLVFCNPSFQVFYRVDACALKDLFAFGSDALDGGERCGLEQFEMLAYSL